MLEWPEYYSDIVIQNLGDEDVWVTTDGSTVVAAEDGALVVPAGQFAVFGNRTPIPDITLPDWPGTTQVSLVTESGSTECLVSPQ
jgi:hypothetical protein